MSLECAECRRLMGPSDQLPGSDGTLVFPNLPSIVWSFSDNNLQFHLRHTLTQQNRSLCFRCIDDACSPDGLMVLHKVYECYIAEIKYKELDAYFHGKWIQGDEDREKIEAREIYLGLLEALPITCLHCGNDFHQPDLPYLQAQVFDRLACKDHLGGLPGEKNYQWSFLREGETFIMFCFGCFRKHFPRTFEYLGNDLSGIDKKEEGRFSATITPEVYQALVREVGQEEAEKKLRELGASVRPLPRD